MKRKILSLYTIASMLLVGMPVFAVPNHTAMELSTPAFESKELFLPDAAGNAPVLVPLGTAVDPSTNKVVEGFMFIHYKNDFAKPSGVGKPKPGSSVCYAFLANGAKWKVTEDYVFDPDNNFSSTTPGMDQENLRALLAQGLNEWDAQVAFEIFGNEVAGVIDPNTINLNAKNEVFFADIDTNGVIAVTIVWGIFRGPAWQRELVEWDMVFDDVSFNWSAEATGVAGKMDFLNIAVHEIGHAAGMGHPSDSCLEETMYRYAGFGEIKKRDLNTGDIAGVKALYP